MAQLKDSAEAELLRALPTFAAIGIGRTKAYELLNTGLVSAVKVGRSTFIRRTDWDDFIRTLPAYPANSNSNSGTAAEVA